VEVLNLYPHRKGEPGDIAVIAMFLASDESRHADGNELFQEVRNRI
jgi:hypothetical protein